MFTGPTRILARVSCPLAPRLLPQTLSRLQQLARSPRSPRLVAVVVVVVVVVLYLEEVVGAA